MSRECYVYIIETELENEDDTYPYHLKVGISSNVGSRLLTLQTSHPRKLVLSHFFKLRTREEAAWVERRCHHLLAKDRKAGEWFDTDPTYALVAVIDAIIGLKLTGQTGLRLDDVGVSPYMLQFALGIDGDHARAWRTQK